MISATNSDIFRVHVCTCCESRKSIIHMLWPYIFFSSNDILLRLSKKAIYYVFPLVDDSLKYPLPGVGHRKKFVFVGERQSVDPL